MSESVLDAIRAKILALKASRENYARMPHDEHSYVPAILKAYDLAILAMQAELKLNLAHEGGIP